MIDNFSSIRFRYVLMSEYPEGSFAVKEGWVSGHGSWSAALQWMNYKDAKEARDNPHWHNQPDKIRKCEIVRLEVHVNHEVKLDNVWADFIHARAKAIGMLHEKGYSVEEIERMINSREAQ